MKVNPAKSQAMHIRNHQRPRCDESLVLNNHDMEYVTEYKYLGYWLQGFLIHTTTVEALATAAGRSFGWSVNIFKYMGDMGYETYCTLYQSYILPVANYAAEVWGFRAVTQPQVVQNRVQRSFWVFTDLPHFQRPRPKWIG